MTTTSRILGMAVTFTVAVSLIPSATTATITAQTWTQASPATSPSARRTHAMAYDWGRQRAVMFGGRDASNSDLGDTWEWDGTTWSQQSPATSPPARWYHAMAFDVARQRVVLFGGGAGTSTRLSDTWEWDGVNWTRRTPTTVPPGRYRHVMDYDIQRRRVVMFGGTTGTGAPGRLNDTWEWDGTNWQQVQTTNSPPARISATLTYDFVRARMVLYGGYDGTTTGTYGDTWLYDGTNWVEAAPVTVPIERFSQAAAYDRSRLRIVMFGGRNYRTPSDRNDTHEWDGTDWIEATPSSSPTPRYLSAMVYDITRQQIVMFGGTPNLNETWIYQVSSFYGTFGAGCAGTVGVPTLSRDLAPAINQTFRIRMDNLPPQRPGIVFTGVNRTSWLGIPLPLDLTVIGMPGCQVYTDGLVVLGVNSGAAGATTFSLPLPNDPTMVGFMFYNQAFFVDPSANAGGLVATNGGQGVIGN